MSLGFNHGRGGNFITVGTLDQAAGLIVNDVVTLSESVALEFNPKAISVSDTTTVTESVSLLIPFCQIAVNDEVWVAPPDAAVFDGTNDYMTTGAGLVGVSDSKTGIFSAWIRTDIDATTLDILFGATTVGGSTQRMLVFRGASGVVIIRGYSSAGTSILDFESTSTVTTSSGWAHILASWDLSTGTAVIYINDVNVTNLITATNQNIDYTVADWGVGAQPSGSLKFNGAIAELYFAPGQYLDFSVESNRRKFIAADRTPVPLGIDGSTPTGTAPAVYLHLKQDAAGSTFNTNYGTGGDFSITGALTTDKSLPGPIAMNMKVPPAVYDYVAGVYSGAAYFDGSNDYMERGAELTGIADSKSGILSFWLSPGPSGTALQIINTDAGGPAYFDVTYNYGLNRINISAKNSGGTVILNCSSVGSQVEYGRWNHILAAWDLSTTTIQIYVNNVSSTSPTVVTNDTIDYTRGNYAIGADVGGTNKNEASLAEFYFAPGQYLNLSTESNRRKFITANGGPVNLGADGSTPTGVAPIVYQRVALGAAASTFATNLGSGGNFTITGSLDYAELPGAIAESVVMNVKVMPYVFDSLPGLTEAIGTNLKVFPYIFDVVTVTEDVTVSAQLDLFPNVFDATTVTDVVVQVYLLLSPNVFDTPTATESQTINVKLMPYTSDTSAVTESVTGYILLSPYTFDLTTLTESVTGRILLGLYVFDSPIASESISIVLPISPYGFDIVTVTEDVTLSFGVITPNVFDTLSIADVVTQVHILIYPAVADSPIATDAATNRIKIMPNVFDQSAVTESPKMNLLLMPNRSDTTTVTENSTLLLAQIKPSVFDLTTLSEFTQRNLLLFPYTFDLVTPSESVTMNLKVMPFVAENTITVSESVTMNVILGPYVFDTATLTEAVTLSVLLYPFVSDTTTITDAVTLSLPLFPQGADVVTVTESITVNNSILILEGYRWRDDDNNEALATWKADQDTPTAAGKLQHFRLRVLIDAQANPSGKQFKLQYRKVGDSVWNDVTT